jgi:hypothetical protein
MTPLQLFEQANDFAARAERSANKGHEAQAISELATAVACLAQAFRLKELSSGGPTEGHPND